MSKEQPHARSRPRPRRRPTTPPTDDTESTEPTDGETTAPGTELSYGDTATVALNSYGEEAIAEWTVSSVEPGADDESGVITQYRINIQLTAVTDLTSTFILPSFDFEGLDAKGDLTGVRYTAGDAYDEDKGRPIVWKP